MKKVLVLLSILVLSLTGLSQSELGLSFCGIEQSSMKKGNESKTFLSFDRLSKCVFSPINSSLKLHEFYVGMEIQGDYKSFRISENRLNEKIIIELEKSHPRCIYIEQIKLSEKEESILIGKSFSIHIKY